MEVDGPQSHLEVGNNSMKKITEQVKPVIAREPGKKNGAIGGVLIGPDGKPVKGSWRKISDLPAGQRPPQANIDNFLKVEKNKQRQAQIEAEKERLRGVGNPPPTRQPAPDGQPAAPKQTIVLAKKDGVEGKLDKATGKFTSGNFSDEEKARYAKFSKPKAPMSDPDGAVEKEKYLSSQDYKDDMKASADADAAYKASSTPENKAARDRANLKIWAKAHPRLAEVERLRNQQRAAGKNPYDKEFVTKVTAPVLYGYPNPKVPGSGRSVEDSKKMFPDTPEPAPAPAPGNETPEMKKVGDTLSANPLPKKPVKKEAYDIVLDYLFSEGHVESISEAHYVMMQMDAKYIQNIVEAMSSGNSGDPLGRIPKLKAEMELAALQRQRNQQRARDALRPGSYGVPSFAKHSEQQLEYGHSDAGLTKAQSRQILAQNRRDLEVAAGLKPGSTEKDAYYNDPNYGKNLDGKMKFFSPRTVLAKQRGVEGKLTVDPNTGKKTFTAGAFTDAEKARYTSKGGK